MYERKPLHAVTIYTECVLLGATILGGSLHLIGKNVFDLLYLSVFTRLLFFIPPVVKIPGVKNKD